jgi:methyl-accepting chemotaxis protein
MVNLLPLRIQVRNCMAALALHFPQRFTRDELNWVDSAGVLAPGLLCGGTLLNMNHEEIDRFTSRTHATATLFVASGDDFVRIATSVKNQHGERVVGTSLDRSHPGYRSLRAGQAYAGYATLFGKQYMTRYEPIRDGADRVIGVMYVGLDVSEVFTLSVWARISLLALVFGIAVLLGYAGVLGASLNGVTVGFALLGALLIGTLVFVVTRQVIGRELVEAKAAAEKLAAGDLMAQARVDRRDELGQLLQAINSIGVRLSTVVMNVRSNAENVSSASSRIFLGNNQLSERTEQQASALQQTAASMEELNTTVRQNDENARRANQLALNASSVAARGGDVVEQVVETMKSINASSGRISDIISVIDGIAFQTNILALNAAVEAARAGEQGRGFAVVAAEVRSLASRSAEAAKEIKRLIGDSVARVEQGTALVDTAGTTMAEIVRSIGRVTELMGEISAASSEQSEGVAQVGEAIVRLEQTTQQNSALVEGMAEASTNLEIQSRDMLQAVSAFTLAQDSARLDKRG